MKNKSIIAIIAIVLLVLVGTALVVRSFRASRTQREQLKDALALLSEAYRNGEVENIDLASITPFTWERVYIFGPYTPTEQIVATVGTRWLGIRETNISSHDGIVLFVFVNKSRVVQQIDYPRSPDFVDAVRESGYSILEAVFVMDEKGKVISNSP